MPLYDYQCLVCHSTEEHVARHTVTSMHCTACGSVTQRLWGAPASIRMANMNVINKRRQRIKEPTFLYPDGHRESLNSTNTRAEE